MQDWPRITVVTPSYNQAAYVAQTIESVLDQGYPNLEYIVMDGDSSDDSPAIIRRYAPRLAYWQSAPDRGQADAIYQGFARATGEILCWVNSDDLLLPGALHRVACHFRDHPREECAVGGCLVIDAAGQPIRTDEGSPLINWGSRVSFDELLRYGCSFNQPASFWRRQTFFEVGGFDTGLRFCFDYDMYLRLARRRRFSCIPHLLACFRVHGESKTSTLQDVCDSEARIVRARLGRAEENGMAVRFARWRYAASARWRNRRALAALAAGMIELPRLPGPAQMGRTE